jgi:hypothetical protein
MKKVKWLKILMWIIMIVIVLACGWIYMVTRGYVPNKTVYSYQYSKPWNLLPESKRLTFEESKKFIDMKDDKSICVRTGVEPIREELFTQKTGSNCKPEVDGCWSSYTRNTIVCGDQYLITEINSAGPMTYGVFSF